MAIKLTGNYAKRLGLPGYSSHQFSISIETELTDLAQVQEEASRIYRLLQDAVDHEIQNPGFVPDDEYGLKNLPQPIPTNGHRNGTSNGNGHTHSHGSGGNGSTNGNNRQVRWACSDKQKELVLKLVTDNELDRDTVEEIALDRFGVGVKQLNKLQASGLIAELIELTGKGNGRQTHVNGRKGAKR